MKKTIALIEGGYSREYEISLKSAANVENHLDKNLYQVYRIRLQPDSWKCFTSSGEYEVNRNDFSVETPQGLIRFDAALIMLHGTPGEDGLLQGYFDMLQIPYSTCNARVSAVTFDKGFCNPIIASLGVLIAPSLYMHKGDNISAEAVLAELKLPVFVKPAAGGSSFGVTKVKQPEQLEEAITNALKEDGSVLIEEYIPGREITCGVFNYKGSMHVFPPTEVVSHNEFFDFEAKYKGESEEITPAPIDESLILRCQSLSAMIYKRLNCSGVVRVDYILNDNEFFFLEINTVPGMSDASIVPQQVAEYGWTPAEFCNKLVEDTLWRAGKK